MQITCAGNPETVLKSLLDAGANAEIDGGNLIVNTRLGRELLAAEDVVTIDPNPRAGRNDAGGQPEPAVLVIVEASRQNNPDATFTGEPA